MICLLSDAFAQQSTINGKAKGDAGELVRLISYADLFSKLEKTLASTYIDINGVFKLDVSVKNTEYTYLAVGLKRGEFYLSPGSKYQFTVIADSLDQRGSIFDELPLQFTLRAQDNDLSDAIGAFNVEFNTFVYENARKIYYGRDNQTIIDFKNKVKEQIAGNSPAYLKNYIDYSIASLEWTSKIKSNDSILLEYFAGKPILYNNIQYTDFFTDFIKTYFVAENVFSYGELIDALNEGSGINNLRELILRKAPFRSDPQLTELITTILIAKKYHNTDVRKKRVLSLLDEIRLNGDFTENKKIAANFIQKLQILESGTVAPSFRLRDAEGNTWALSDFKDQFVLLSFVKPSCVICLNQMGLLARLAESFPGKMRNVTLVFGEDFKKVTRFAYERDFDWPILDIDNDILLLEAYNIRAYPSYVILNPDGTISMATAPMPDENLDLYLQRQISRYEPKVKQ